MTICGSIPLQLPTMTFNIIKIKRENSVKFLGVTINENLTWKNHIEVTENKVSKKIGILSRASHLLDLKNLKIYFSFIRIFLLHYANIVWANTFKIKLQGILKKQKHDARMDIFLCKQIWQFETIIKRDGSFICLSNQHNSNSKIYDRKHWIITQGISFLFLSVNFLLYLITPIDSTNDKKILCAELFKAIFKH